MVQGKKKAVKASKKHPSLLQPSMDQMSFELIQNEQLKLSRNEADNIVSSINRALHKRASAMSESKGSGVRTPTIS